MFVHKNKNFYIFNLILYIYYKDKMSDKTELQKSLDKLNVSLTTLKRSASPTTTAILNDKPKIKDASHYAKCLEDIITKMSPPQQTTHTGGKKSSFKRKLRRKSINKSHKSR